MLFQPCRLHVVGVGEIIHVLTHSKRRQKGEVGIQEMLADKKTCFCFQRRLCTFMRFLSEEELRSLRLLFFIAPAAYFLLTERKGPWMQGFPLYFSLCVLQHGGKTNGFLPCPGANQMSFQEPWHSNSFEVSPNVTHSDIWF